MSKGLDQIKQKFRSATVVDQIIYINIVVFIITYVFKALATLMQWNTSLVFHWFSLPANLSSFYSKPWTLITYGFLHGDFLHILFNVIVLYYFGAEAL